MEKLPKIKEFNAPEGYFDGLQDTILTRERKKSQQVYWKYAAAAVLVLSLGVWQYGRFNSTPSPVSIDDQALLYIESNQWTAEDVLSLSDDPNAILDQILEEELSQINSEWPEDDWF